VAGRRLDKLQETVLKVQAINNGKTKTIAVQTDLLKDTDVANLFAETIKTFGRSPNVVLSNAGVVAEAKIGKQSPNDWWEVMVSRNSLSISLLRTT
jgi:NADP-dependent 3-hydroxy acid dehydrogenase YdfG